VPILGVYYFFPFLRWKLLDLISIAECFAQQLLLMQFQLWQQSFERTCHTFLKLPRKRETPASFKANLRNICAILLKTITEILPSCWHYQSENRSWCTAVSEDSVIGGNTSTRATFLSWCKTVARLSAFLWIQM